MVDRGAILDRLHVDQLRHPLPPSAATTFDTDAATNLNACIRAGDPGEAYAILRARIPRNGMRRTGLLCAFRRLSGLLGGCVGWQNRNNGRKDDFSHQLFLACSLTLCRLN
jgi:hypothetical protein